MYAWLVVALLSAAYVGVDQFRNNPEATVMKWGFVLVTLYMGPIGLLLYVMADKEPVPGTHEQFVAPLWKQGVGSTVHCVAGDATGIILAAITTAVLGLPMWADLIVEYVAGFLFGLFVFQALFMRAIMGGSYRDNMRRSFLPELLSMNLMMAGMAPVMTWMMMGRDMRAMWPTYPLFWFVMSIGVIAGFILTYPINVWLVSKKLKHGLMTVRPGMPRGHDMAAMEGSAVSGGPADTPASHGAAATLAATSSASPMPDMPGMAHGASGRSASDVNAPADTSKPTRTQIAAVAACTFLALLAGMYGPATRNNFRLSAEAVGGAIMPPGMITTPDTPAEAMRDMAAADPRLVSYAAPADARGDRPLRPRLEGAVKVFDLDASIIRWNILPWKTMTAYAINRAGAGTAFGAHRGRSRPHQLHQPPARLGHHALARARRA